MSDCKFNEVTCSPASCKMYSLCSFRSLQNQLIEIQNQLNVINQTLINYGNSIIGNTSEIAALNERLEYVTADVSQLFINESDKENGDLYEENT